MDKHNSAWKPLLVCCLALLLSGCMLMSGEQSLSDAQPSGGNFSTTFVSADGDAERTVATRLPATQLDVIVILENEQGELNVELLAPGGAVAVAVRARPDEQISKSGQLVTDDQGLLRYRVRARSARNGSLQVLYQRSG